MYALSLVINTVTHITAHTMFAYILLVIKWTAALLAMAMACAFWLFAGARRAFGPLKVVWDMDDCLIKSHRLEKLASQTAAGNEKDSALRETVTATFRGRSGVPAGEHVDDDLERYQTLIRPWTRAVLFVLKNVCGVRNFVFTSASGGYMRNALAILDPRRLYFDGALSMTDFPAYHLQGGKDPRELLRRAGGAPKDGVHPSGVDLGPVCWVMVDDNPRYHQATPHNGLLIVKIPVDVRELSAEERADPGCAVVPRAVLALKDPRDATLLRVAWRLAVLAASAPDVRAALRGRRHAAVDPPRPDKEREEYWRPMAVARAFQEGFEACAAIAEVSIVMPRGEFKTVHERVWQWAAVKGLIARSGGGPIGDGDVDGSDDEQIEWPEEFGDAWALDAQAHWAAVTEGAKEKEALEAAFRRGWRRRARIEEKKK